jgi:hypothetical protein
VETSEDNAPLPKIKSESDEKLAQKLNSGDNDTSPAQNVGSLKRSASPLEGTDSPRKQIKTEKSSPSPVKQSTNVTKGSGRKMRSATSNNTVVKTPTKINNAKITSFFGK